VLLTGGGAQLGGLGDYLEEELGVPVSLWSGAEAVSAMGVDGDTAVGAAPQDTQLALASAVAWAGGRGGKQINLRQGPFVYKASFSLLRQKAVHLGALAATLILCVTVDAVMSLARLSEQRDVLEAQLRSATQELFGEPRLDGREVTARLKRGHKEDMAPIPKATAFDLLEEISKKMPASDKVKVDILQLDIKPKKTYMKGNIDSGAAVDDIVAGLKQIDCFEEITKGPISGVSGGAVSFSLTINSHCP
jgi:hypothetical protein